MSSKIKLTITKEGTVICDWWTPEAADLLCSMCKKCKGWKSEEKPLGCVTGNQWCG